MGTAGGHGGSEVGEGAWREALKEETPMDPEAQRSSLRAYVPSTTTGGLQRARPSFSGSALECVRNSFRKSPLFRIQLPRIYTWEFVIVEAALMLTFLKVGLFKRRN